jgi:phage portal protein BeeE
MSWISKFFSRRNTSVNSQAWAQILGGLQPTKIGSTPTAQLQEGYEENIDIYSVFKKTYDVYTSIPRIVEKRTADGWEIEEDTTIHELWENPNVGKGYTWTDIDTQRIIYLLANGNSFMLGEKGFGSTIQEVDILPSPSITIQTGQDFFLPNVKYQFSLGPQIRDYTKEELQQIVLFNPSFQSVQEAQWGLSLIQVAARVVKVGNDRWDADASLLQNRGAIGLVTDRSDRPMTREEAKETQESFDQDTAGTHNFGRIKVTNKNLDFVQMAMNSTDLQLLEKGVVNLRSICNVLGYDSSLFNDPANKTFNNRKEAETAMFTNVMMPLAKKFDEQDTQFIALNHYPDGSRRIRHDFSEIEALQSDKKEEAEKDKTRMDGVNTILNMPISEEGKRILLINEYDIPEDVANIIVQNEEPQTEDGNEPI